MKNQLLRCTEQRKKRQSQKYHPQTQRAQLTQLNSNVDFYVFPSTSLKKYSNANQTSILNYFDVGVAAGSPRHPT
jgi:hypothetical protein